MNSISCYLFRLAFSGYFRLTGWKVTGNIPHELKKCIIIGAPHTSNYDFIYARGLFYIINRPTKYIAKQELLESPIAWFFRLTGAIGVSRHCSQNMVNKMVELLGDANTMCILLSPEGTRKSMGKWRSGFYYAAMQAQVPIVLMSLDYSKKLATVGPNFQPTGDYQKDMELVKEFYRDVTPKNAVGNSPWIPRIY